MKIRIVLFVLIIAASCKKPDPQRNVSFLHGLMDSLHLDTEKNIIIYTINPNDCINCMIALTEINSSMKNLPNSQLYVISIEREIEKKQWLRSTDSRGIKDTLNRKVVWDRQLFDEINRSTNRSLPISLFSIYNYRQDSIVFSKPIKEISSTDNLRRYLEK